MPSMVAGGIAVAPPKVALTENIQTRVASAMNVSPELVHIESYRTGFSGFILRCTGTCAGKGFFAKIFLVDPYPIPPRFATPGEELATPEKLERSVQEQILAEWTMLQQMRSLVGTENIPTPLAFSLEARTLVLEEVNGLRMDRFVNWGWPDDRKVRSVEAAMLQAGKWLRALHNATFQGHETIEFRDVLTALQGLMRKKEIATTPYASLALKALEAARPDANSPTSLCVPVALNHGDFSLPNLIWNHHRQHLWVVDFELSARRAILHDLSMMMFEFRKALLHPLTSQATVRRWEKAFWAGYGTVAPDLFAFTNALATARLFYHTLPRLSTLRKRRGWKGGLKAFVYRNVLQPFMISRILPER